MPPSVSLPAPIGLGDSGDAILGGNKEPSPVPTHKPVQRIGTVRKATILRSTLPSIPPLPLYECSMLEYPWVHLNFHPVCMGLVREPPLVGSAPYSSC